MKGLALGRLLGFVGLPALVLTLVSAPVVAQTLLAADQNGNLISVNVVNGVGTPIGQQLGLPLSTEIEADQTTGQLYSEEFNGAVDIHELNPATGLSIGSATHGCCAFNGLEFVGGTLYGTNVMGGGGVSPSTFETLNPQTGVNVVIGPTGTTNITGLAYEKATGILWGILPGTPQTGFAQLVTINIATGMATPSGGVFDGATGGVLDHIGSIEFASDGVLYGGMGLNSSLNPGWLISINTATNAANFIGPTGLQGITGLTNITPQIGACCTDGPNEESECIEVTEADCDQAGPDGGLFLGAGTVCADVLDCVPLLVTMDTMSAEEVAGGVMIRWTTALEIDTAGFRVLRQVGNGREKRRMAIGFVPATGNNIGGATYELLDNSREAGEAVFYFLLDVDAFGRETEHGPILVDRGTRQKPQRNVRR